MQWIPSRDKAAFCNPTLRYHEIMSPFCPFLLSDLNGSRLRFPFPRTVKRPRRHSTTTTIDGVGLHFTAALPGSERVLMLTLPAAVPPSLSCDSLNVLSPLPLLRSTSHGTCIAAAASAAAIRSLPRNSCRPEYLSSREQRYLPGLDRLPSLSAVGDISCMDDVSPRLTILRCTRCWGVRLRIES